MNSTPTLASPQQAAGRPSQPPPAPAEPFQDVRPLRHRRRTDYEETVSQADEVFAHLQGGLENCVPGFESAAERREYLESIRDAARSPHFGEAFARRIDAMLEVAL